MDRYPSLHDDDKLRPILKEYNNLPCCMSHREDFHQANRSDWDCFNHYELLTPPLSPEQRSPNIDLNLPTNDAFTSSFLTTPPSNFVEELLSTKFANDFPRVLPDLKETCSELFAEEPPQSADSLKKVFSQSKSKDCMWNGRGVGQAGKNRSHSRSESPCSPVCSPMSGCVDPRSVFNQYGDRRKSSSPRRKRVSSRAETPSDSEEEVDVVTVENSSRVSKQPTVGLMSEGGKVLGRLVQKSNGPQPRLALVTTGRNQKEINGSQQSRGRTPRKTKNQPMSMVIRNGNGPAKTVNVQLKCVPIVKSSAKPVAMKRKLNGSVATPVKETVLHLMRITPTAPAVPKTDASDIRKKKQILSLEGISMVTSTGVKRVTKNPIPTPGAVKSETIDYKLGFTQRNCKVAALTSAFPVEKKKAPRKSTKKAGFMTFETPTSSPGSANGELPLSPKKRGGTRLSGAEEELIREAHNVLERQRREGLRNLYHNLRMVVPEVAEVEKAPKVSILTKAREHVFELQRQAEKFRVQKFDAQERQNILKRRLRELASGVASPGMTPYTNSVYIKREFPDSFQNFAVFR